MWWCISYTLGCHLLKLGSLVFVNPYTWLEQDTDAAKIWSCIGIFEEDGITGNMCEDYLLPALQRLFKGWQPSVNGMWPSYIDVRDYGWPSKPLRRTIVKERSVLYPASRGAFHFGNPVRPKWKSEEKYNTEIPGVLKSRKCSTRSNLLQNSGNSTNDSLKNRLKKCNLRETPEQLKCKCCAFPALTRSSIDKHDLDQTQN